MVSTFKLDIEFDEVVNLTVNKGIALKILPPLGGFIFFSCLSTPYLPCPLQARIWRRGFGLQ